MDYTLREDRLIRQYKNKKDEIVTVRKRLPNDVDPIIKEIQNLLKQHNGNAIPVVKNLKKEKNLSLVEATKLFKSATDIDFLPDRFAPNYKARQMVKDL